ncbi:hypothetical protein [Streptomyces sp. NPDC055085]
MSNRIWRGRAALVSVSLGTVATLLPVSAASADPVDITSLGDVITNAATYGVASDTPWGRHMHNRTYLPGSCGKITWDREVLAVDTSKVGVNAQSLTDSGQATSYQVPAVPGFVAGTVPNPLSEPSNVSIGTYQYQVEQVSTASVTDTLSISSSLALSVGFDDNNKIVSTLTTETTNSNTYTSASRNMTTVTSPSSANLLYKIAPETQLHWTVYANEGRISQPKKLSANLTGTYRVKLSGYDGNPTGAKSTCWTGDIPIKDTFSQTVLPASTIAPITMQNGNVHYEGAAVYNYIGGYNFPISTYCTKISDDNVKVNCTTGAPL